MNEQMAAVLERYFGSAAYSMEDVPYGLTNVTRIVTVDGQRYVARLYNRHTKTASLLELEHALTAHLAASGFSAGVPLFLQTSAGDYHVELPDGTLGAVTTFLEGTAPALADAEDARIYGGVVGELTQALRNFQAGERLDLGVSFLEAERLHPLADDDGVARFFGEPPFTLAPDELAFYNNAVAELANESERLRRLPKQIVHHDVLVFNLLAEGRRMSGVLDFDLASLDVGAMEFAIALNHVLQLSGGGIAMAEAFMQGYAAFARHSDEELNELRALTRAYHIAVLRFYIGQHYAGASIEQPFRYILQQFIMRDAWLERHGAELRRLAGRMVGSGDQGAVHNT